MCGILGIFDVRGIDLSRMKAGLTDLRHRGPDAENHVIAEEGRLFLGHTRLKVIDMKDTANQPMVSSCGRYTLIFNGEIFNFRQLRQQIGETWPWRTASDTEVLLVLYSQYGKSALTRLNGMFAFCIYDRERHCLFLCRDRFGIKPLYYLHSNQALVFSSEIHPLLRYLDHVEEDRRTILTYLETGLYDFGSHTFFKDIHALEPGCWLEININTGETRIERWYNLLDHVPDLSGLNEKDLVDTTESLVREAITDHLVADVSVGVNVSGGVDSSMLVRVAVEKLGDVHLFTQDYEGYSEERWVREIAHGGTLHLQRLTRESIDAVLPEVVRCEGEPFGGVFVCGYHYIYKAADQEGVTVLLDGNGVDESFLGYKKYHEIFVHKALGSAIEAKAREDYATFWGEPPPSRRSEDNRVVSLAIDGTIATYADAVTDTLRSAHEPYEIPTVDFFADPLKNAAATDILYAKIPRGLRFNDRISMSLSKELRVPYLDHRLVEFAFGIPTPYLLNDKGTKAIFRQAAARLMPVEVAYARKRSVQSPQREWLAEGWQPMIKALLLSDSFRARGWIDPSKAMRFYDDYVAGDRSNSFCIWQWLNLELWAQEFLG